MIEVVPAIIPESFEEIAAKAAQVKRLVRRVQIDVADGSYAPSTTWPYDGDDTHMDALAEEGEGLPFWDELEYEVDLLIKEPEHDIDRWIHAGIAAAVIHIESTDNPDIAIAKLKEMNVDVGIGIKPSTPNTELYKYIDSADFVQCMGNDEIGYHGVELDEHVFEKIREIRGMYPELPIAVDIGVNTETAPKLVEAGATKLVSGSAIFGSENIGETIEHLKNL